VNHYQRLKVAQDAPPEVIRAAYRALATKLHPDRQGPNTGPTDALHSEMAALNAAYEALIDPKLRADYDATLHAPAAAARAEPGWFANTEAQEDDARSDAGPQTRVDMDWLAPGANEAPKKLWPLKGQNLLMASAGGGLLLIALVWSVWSSLSQRQVEDALSRQYRAAPHSTQMAALDAPRDPMAAPPAERKPSVDELSRMSDEELLKVLPTLDDDGRAHAPHSGSFAVMARHPLDGAPLKLRTERDLVDPLAEPVRR
jgi:DnaJ-domain-containing protein 1